MHKGQPHRCRHRMTVLALLLLAVACGTPQASEERTPGELAAAAPIEIVVTRSMDAQVLQPARAANIPLGDHIQLLGYDFQVAGQTLNLALYWQAREPVDKSYIVFVHVFDSQGELQGQKDSPPVGGDLLTSSWQPGEVVVDPHTVPLVSDAPMGTYRVEVGMYDTDTNERLPVLDGTGQKIPEGQIMLDLGVEGKGTVTSTMGDSPTCTAPPAMASMTPTQVPVASVPSTPGPVFMPTPVTTAFAAQVARVAAPTITSQPSSRPTPMLDKPPQTLSFTASPDPMDRGGTVTLTWNAPRATSVGITRLSPEGDIFLETEALHLPASGSITLPVPEEYTESVKYYLGSRGVKGVLHRAYVTVGIICRYDEYVAPRCPLTQDTIWAAYEPFEHGHMVWRSDTREIYVLYADGSFEIYQDTWLEGDPVDISVTPAPGLHAPVRGFGNLYARHAPVRERLGWATAPEAGYTMWVETIRGGSGRYPATSAYFTLPDNRVVNLYPFTSTWEIIP